MSHIPEISDDDEVYEGSIDENDIVVPDSGDEYENSDTVDPREAIISDSDESLSNSKHSETAMSSYNSVEKFPRVNNKELSFVVDDPVERDESNASRVENDESKTTCKDSKSKKKNVISSDSDDDDNNVMKKSASKKKNVIGSDSDENDNDCIKKSITQKNYVISDSEEDTYVEPLPDLPNSSAQFERSRISQDFRNKRLLCSTFVESPTNTPKNKETGKRLLNTPTETPRSFKQIKEAPSVKKENATLTFRETTHLTLSSTSESDDIIDISDDDSRLQPKNQPIKNFKQPTLVQMFKKEPSVNEQPSTSHRAESEILVSPSQYQQQEDEVRRLQSDLLKATTLIEAINLEHLPDKGRSLLGRQRDLENKQLEEAKKLSKMKICVDNKVNIQAEPKIMSWKELEADAGKVQPKTFGQQAMSTYNAQKAMTVDRLQQLHGSLQTCPKETDLAEPPRGLKVELMHHQLRALSWLMWRESQKPSGGILADDMGLGKTLTMISLMLKSNEIEKEFDSDDDEDEKAEKTTKYNGGTLVVCPASLLSQWSGELERRTKRGLASWELYHGPKRETKPKRLARHDMVITTYSIVNNECEKNGAVFRVKWRRIIIDEAHQIRNHKSQTSEAVCGLSARSRWALTGTPVHNKELDMYALIKYLRVNPFDDLVVWKRWVGDKGTGGTERLHTVISSLMLRRTKPELIEKGLLNSMPERKWELIPIELTKSERDVYNKILIFSRTLFAQFLHQRAEKNQDARDLLDQANGPNGPNQEYFRMRQKLLKLNKLRDIKQHEILVLLLRLRQICNHPSLITGMLHEDMELMGDDDVADNKEEALDLLDQLNKLTIDENEDPNEGAAVPAAGGDIVEAPTLKEVVKNVLSPSDPVFSKTRLSSKIKAVIKLLKDKVLTGDDKAIIVSQWPTFLQLIGYQLREEKIKFDQLDGKVPVHKRMEMVDRFNNPSDRMRILLLSLTAGGVGLNLVGANHLVLLDLHWNPQLENQAQDRIYRVGQQKPVFVYKFMATDTIEKRILDLQKNKLEIANSMLTGTVQAARNKLSLQDLKMLFEM